MLGASSSHSAAHPPGASGTMATTTDDDQSRAAAESNLKEGTTHSSSIKVSAGEAVGKSPSILTSPAFPPSSANMSFNNANSASLIPPQPPSPVGRTPSPKEHLTLPSHKARADQIDAIPAGARTPKKYPHSTTPVSAAGTEKRISLPAFDLVALPFFSDTDRKEWPALFTKKIRQGEATFDFASPLCDMRSKDQKSSSLQDLIYLVTEHGGTLDEGQYRQLIQMFMKNVFRPIPPPQNPYGEAFDPEDDEPVYEPSWPHLHLVYELLIRLLESPFFNLNWAKGQIDMVFMHRLLSIFDVEDPRERELVKMTVHRIYAKFLNLRAFIRKSMRNIFYEFIYDDQRHNVAEMLEILGSVVNGFAVPLRDEHKVFLERTLIPLHKNRALPIYYAQLSLCVVQFAEKDPTLSTKIILGLLRLWPKQNTTKQLMFLNEIEEVLDVTPAERFMTFLVPLMRQLSQCIASSHFQVAERALQFLSNEYLVSIVSERSSVMMPILLPSMLLYSRNHWNKSVQMQVFNGLRLFMDLDPKLYEEIATRYASPVNPASTPSAPITSFVNARDSRIIREEQWRKLEEMASSTAMQIDTLTMDKSDSLLQEENLSSAQSRRESYSSVVAKNV